MADNWKWLRKLTKAELKEVHGLIFCDNVRKVEKYPRFHEISFWELWDDGEEGHHIETRYEYCDFEVPRSLDCMEVDYGIRCRFFGYMIKKFGTPYLQELLAYRLRLPEETAKHCKYEVEA